MVMVRPPWLLSGEIQEPPKHIQTARRLRYVDGVFWVAVQRPEGRELHVSQFERPARSGNRDPVFRDAQLPRLVETVGRHHEDAGSLLGQVAQCLAIEVVTVPMRDKGHVEERRQLLGPWHEPRR
jgi:hypothetical protein